MGNFDEIGECRVVSLGDMLAPLGRK